MKSELKYSSLSKELTEKIEEDRSRGLLSGFRTNEKNAIRRNPDKDKPSLLRPAFSRDIDKILNCPFYNRYADKTQVFSFYKNDDITRRALHVQLVSRIARKIGSLLGLNLDLIEAIALGHDMGHTPFGHAGESLLDNLTYSSSGRHFMHNIHSIRVLDRIFPYNITLETLSGIASHNGELELSEYRPKSLNNFEEFDREIEKCYKDSSYVLSLIPSTLEGCVVRISDIIAYLGKDRQDAERAKLKKSADFQSGTIGRYNAEIINNLMVNIVENSYQKPYIKMDKEHFEELKRAKAENYELIYKNDSVKEEFSRSVEPMMEALYERLVSDLKNGNHSSPVFTHHIRYINGAYYQRITPYEEEMPEIIAADYIASMTDDYFIDLFYHLFPESKIKIAYRGYFD